MLRSPRTRHGGLGGERHAHGRRRLRLGASAAIGMTKKSALPVDIQANRHADIAVQKISAPIDFAHTIGADYNPKNGNVTGGHSTVSGDVQVVAITKQPDANGVYEARVQMQDPQGNWIDKKSNQGVNTMFPTSWTENRIKVEIDGAWNSPSKVISGNYWSATSPSGIEIGGYLKPRTTAFPVYGGGK